VLGNSKAFSGIAVRDMEEARRFYADVLGVRVEDGDMGMLVLRLGGDRPVLLYPKADHEPATYTVLNFPVDDVEGAVDALTGRGVVFERYEGTATETDAKGVFRGGGPLIAWFTDPSGNVLSVIQSPGLDG
jgi:catechol 2,3-dioxygenase-like lactoylglutathione lyase family enzyme